MRSTTLNTEVVEPIPTASENSDERESWAISQASEGKSQILQQRVKETGCCADRVEFFGLLDAAELATAA